MKSLIIFVLLVTPLIGYSKNKIDGGKFQIYGGSETYESGTFDAIKNRRDAFFYGNNTASEGIDDTSVALGLGYLHQAKSGFSWRLAAQGGILQDRASKEVDDPNLDILESVLLVPLSKAKISAEFDYYYALLDLQLGYYIKLGSVGLRPYIAGGYGYGWVTEKWEIKESFSYPNRELSYKFRAEAPVTDVAAGLELSLENTFFIYGRYGYRAFKASSVSKSVSTKNIDQEVEYTSTPNSYSLTGTYLALGIGISF